MVTQNSPAWAGANLVELVAEKGSLDAFDWATLKLALLATLNQVSGTQSQVIVIQGAGGEQWGTRDTVYSLRITNPLLNDLSVKRLEKEISKVVDEFDKTVTLNYGTVKVL